MKPTLKPHEFRALVDALYDTARIYEGTQQLRARISSMLRAYVVIADDRKKDDQ